MPQVSKNSNIPDFEAIAVSVASPDDILGWSHGEVTKPETINYRTQKPERGGLFCERIFGPTKNWECYCGKYKRIRYKGVVCEKCGVEVTRSIVRRERMGNIKLAVPITHTWYLRSTPSRIGLFLDLPVKHIEQVVYFAAYIITEVDQKAKEEALVELENTYKQKKKEIQMEYQKSSSEKPAKKGKETGEEMNEENFNERIKTLDESFIKAREQLKSLEVGKVISEIIYRDLSMQFGHVFQASIGSEAIRQIISNIELSTFIELRKEELKKTSGQKQKKIMKRLKLASSLLKAGIKPEWMILTILPVLSPDLRPMVQLDGGRFAASDLNDLYRRVINRNNRLKRLIEIGAPEVICRNEKRMLQEAVDTLLNSDARVSKATFNVNERRKLRSLSDMLKGKQGRFRQNLLGKRVDYSGRSVIVVGPTLQLHQCGIPKEMALKLFKPFVIGHLIRDGLAYNVKNAERVITSNRKEVWDILEKVTAEHYVLLNRAPTLHRLGIQAFQPVLIEGKAIQIHPLVCAAYNADFDGDQMAVHIPLSENAQREAKNIMSSVNNLLKPSSGEPIITAAQDIVLGSYYLTRMKDEKAEPKMNFTNIDEALRAYGNEYIGLQDKIRVRINGEILETTVGRLIFNRECLPLELWYVNKTMTKKELKRLIASTFEHHGKDMTVKISDSIKTIGYKYATMSGISIGYDDMMVPAGKEKVIEESSEMVKQIVNKYWKGWITSDERHNALVRVWNEAKRKIADMMIKSYQPDNHIYIMVDSGARGDWGSVTQLSGMKGLVANPSGKTIELPVKANYKEGLSILEYFINTHSGRKGKSDTALKTSEAGYLTRKLVDSVQRVIVREYDCGNDVGVTISRSASHDVGISFEQRVFGRTLAKTVVNPQSGEVLGEARQQITESMLKSFQQYNVAEVTIASVAHCLAEDGVCQKCYGLDLGFNQPVDIGTPVGIIAAQSIGEPGTQLTMRTFHMGGVAEGTDITQGLTRVEELFEARTPKTPAVISEISGIVSVKKKKDVVEVTVKSKELGTDDYVVYGDLQPLVKVGETVRQKQVLIRSRSDKNMVIRSMNSGVVSEVSEKKLSVKQDVKQERAYKIPSRLTMIAKEGQEVVAGDPLTIGHLDLKVIMHIRGVAALQSYIVNEVQRIYASQGQTINDKHIEIIVKQMLSKIRILDPGESTFLPGEISNIVRYEKTNRQLREEGKKEAYGERLLLGITKVSLYTDSWLSAASFQETIRVLVEASVTRKIDFLEGLKENVIIGRLIPAGFTYKEKAHR